MLIFCKKPEDLVAKDLFCSLRIGVEWSEEEKELLRILKKYLKSREHRKEFVFAAREAQVWTFRNEEERAWRTLWAPVKNELRVDDRYNCKARILDQIRSEEYWEVNRRLMKYMEAFCLNFHGDEYGGRYLAHFIRLSRVNDASWLCRSDNYEEIYAPDLRRNFRNYFKSVVRDESELYMIFYGMLAGLNDNVELDFIEQERLNELREYFYTNKEELIKALCHIPKA